MTFNCIYLISHKEANLFMAKWHYTKKLPTGKNILFGWYVPDLYAVAVYGIGVNPYIYDFLKKEYNILTNQDTLIELRRLARSEPIRDLYLSQFLSGCHKILKLKGYKYCITYSDPEYGHDGSLYKACNFTHIGQTRSEWHLIDKKGKIYHRRIARRYMERHNVSIQKAREQLNLTRIKRLPKDRWLIKL